MGTRATGELDRVRAALADVAPRLVALLRAVRHPDRPAVGVWSVLETAVHVTHACEGIGRILAGEGPRIAGIWDLEAATQQWVADEPDRDVQALADRIEVAFADLFTRTDGVPDEPRPWLVDGVSHPLSVICGHLLNEVVVHGYDIARAEERDWAIDADHAAIILTGFIFPLFASLDAREMVVQDAAAGLHATIAVRLRGHGGVNLVFDDGALRVDPLGAGRADCYLSADPKAMLLVAWGRVGQWGPIAQGKLTTWGRRPWLALRLRGLLRNT